MSRFKALALPTAVFVFVLLLLPAIEKGSISIAFEDGEEERSCFDKRDNDDDGLIDCADSDCDGARKWLCQYGREVSCFDSFDNDGDGLTDCRDPDCGARCPETSCSDGSDNDFDGYVDCDDSDCFFFNQDCAGR